MFGIWFFIMILISCGLMFVVVLIYWLVTCVCGIVSYCLVCVWFCVFIVVFWFCCLDLVLVCFVVYLIRGCVWCLFVCWFVVCFGCLIYCLGYRFLVGLLCCFVFYNSAAVGLILIYVWFCLGLICFVDFTFAFDVVWLYWFAS